MSGPGSEAQRIGAKLSQGSPGQWQNNGEVSTTTNGDKIRSMTDEELAKWLCSIMTVECCDCTCPGRDVCTKHNGLDKWLKQEVQE